MTSLGLLSGYGSSSDFESDNDITKESEPSAIMAVEENVPERDKTSSSPLPNYFECADVSDDEEVTRKKKPKKKKIKRALENPFRKRSVAQSAINPSSSVFYNPFLKEQEDKNAILEKHVKLTTNTKDMLVINGKRICWNYRKGRCKFGHNCKYAHDSDLVADKFADSDINPDSIPSNSYEPANLLTDPSESCTKSKRKKPGLTETLVPSKKSRNDFKKIQSKESPWLTQR